jgi:hypothetical protein
MMPAARRHILMPAQHALFTSGASRLACHDRPHTLSRACCMEPPAFVNHGIKRPAMMESSISESGSTKLGISCPLMRAVCKTTRRRTTSLQHQLGAAKPSQPGYPARGSGA